MPASASNKDVTLQPAIDISGAKTANIVSGRFAFPDLDRQLAWIDWAKVAARKLTAGEALTAIGEHGADTPIAIDFLGARLATPGATSAEIYSSLSAGERAQIDKATVLHSGKAPAELWSINAVPQVVAADLSARREAFLGVLTKEWQKSQMFAPANAATPDKGSPSFQGFTLINAARQSFDDLVKAPVLLKIPALSVMTEADRRALVGERFDELALSRDYKVGTIEFSLASTIKHSLQALGEDMPDGLGEKAALLKQFQALVARWQETPQSFLNPVAFAAVHLAKSSGDLIEGTNWQEKLSFASQYFAERWLANYGTPPTVFNRREEAYRLLERETGWDDLDLDENREFTKEHSPNRTQVSVSSSVEHFLYLADKPGIMGREMVLPCEHLEKHNSHVFYPEILLQQAENEHNERLKTSAWIPARAKENLRLAGRELTDGAVESETNKIIGNFEAETEGHRHFVLGARYLRDFVISQIPIVGNAYNIEEGIRLGDIKRIIGGTIGLAIEVGGLAFGMRGGGGAAAEALSEASPRGAFLSELSIPRSEFGADVPGLPVSAAGRADPFQIGLSGDELFSDVPARFQTLEPGEKATYTHLETRQSLMVTRVAGAEEPIALVRVSGQKNIFHVVDWTTGRPIEGAELNPYHINPETGALEPSPKLCGGGGGCSRHTTASEANSDHEGYGAPNAGHADGQSETSARVAAQGSEQPGPSSAAVQEGTSARSSGDRNPSPAPAAANAPIVNSQGEQIGAVHAAPEAEGGMAVPVSSEAESAIHAPSGAKDAAIPIGTRLSSLTTNAQDILVTVKGEDGVRTTYWDDYPNLAGVPEGWNTIPANAPQALPRGPDLEVLKTRAAYVGDRVAGKAYIYEGDYWTVTGGETPGLRGARTELAVQAWNDRYTGYGFGQASAWDLQNGQFAVRTPAIPFPEGYAKSLNKPTGTYARVAPDPANPAPPSNPRGAVEYFVHDVNDREVVASGGHLAPEDPSGQVYWYKSRYWTFQEGSSFEQRYGNAIAFARQWNDAYSQKTGKYAGIKVLPRDESVGVLTAPIPAKDVPGPSTSHAAPSSSLPAGDGGDAAFLRWQEEYSTNGRAVTYRGRDDMPKYHTYIEGEDFSTYPIGRNFNENYVSAVAYAQAWNEKYTASTGKFAILKIGDDNTVRVVTPRDVGQGLSALPQPVAAGSSAHVPSAIEAAEVEASSSIPARFHDVQPEEKREYVHDVTGEKLTVTRIGSTGEIVALRDVPGKKWTYQGIDWETGLTAGHPTNKPYSHYYLNPQNGLIEPGGGLLGGGKGPGARDSFQIGLAGDEVFSDMPTRFGRLEPGEKASYTHSATGDRLIVTRVKSTDETVALKRVDGQKDAFYQVDWTTGEPVKGAKLNTYRLDPQTGAIEPGGKLCGGGPACSRPRTSSAHEAAEEAYGSAAAGSRGGDADARGGAGAGQPGSSPVVEQDVASQGSVGDQNPTQPPAAANAPIVDPQGEQIGAVHTPPPEQAEAVLASGPARPINGRLERLRGEGQDSLIQIMGEDGAYLAYRNDYPNLAATPAGWNSIPEGRLAEPLPRGPDIGTLRMGSEFAGHKVAGRAYIFEGEYWTVPSGDTPEIRAARVELAVKAWNDKYVAYGFGRASAWDLQNEQFAMRTPPIPFPDGYVKSLNKPTGTYARLVFDGASPASISDTVSASADLFYGIGDQEIVMGGGHLLAEEPAGRVYWYKNRYWTFQEGSTVEQRYGNAVAAVKNWNEAYSKNTGQYAGLKVLSRDDSVVVLTPPLPAEEVPGPLTSHATPHVEEGGGEGAVGGSAGTDTMGRDLPVHDGGEAALFRWQEEYNTNGRVFANPADLPRYSAYFAEGGLRTQITGNSFQEQYTRAVAYAQAWNEYHSAETGKYAVIKIDSAGGSVSVETPLGAGGELLFVPEYAARPASHVPADVDAAGPSAQVPPAIGPAEVDASSGMPARFHDVQPGEKREYVHRITDETLTVTRIKSTGEIVALRSVPGEKGIYQGVDWETGLTAGHPAGRPYSHYTLNPQSNLIEPGGDLIDGGKSPSKLGGAMAPEATGHSTPPGSIVASEGQRGRLSTLAEEPENEGIPIGMIDQHVPTDAHASAWM